MISKKIAFVIGHHKFKKGAYSPYLEQTEHDFWMSYKKELELLGDVYRHNPLIPNYRVRQRIMAKKTKNYDLVLELHFNWFNGKVSGCENLCHYASVQGFKISKGLSDNYSELTGSNNRGVKLRTKGQRGYWFVKYQKPTAVIVELFFGDNKEDCERFSYIAFKEALIKTLNI